jgi:formate hydrogenlyase transcriptional activator
MQVMASSFSDSTWQREPHRFERLTAALSSQFARLHVEEIVPSIAGALDQVTAAIEVDNAVLIEFSEDGTVGEVHRAVQADERMPGSHGYPPRWLLDRLAGHELVALSDIDDPPDDECEGEWRAAGWSVLGAPGLVAGQLVCALVVWTRRPSQISGDPIVERVRLVAELLGVTLQRCRHDAQLRASLATIERLNARLAAHNVYLQEEIKTYHDFDEIVGESSTLQAALMRLGQVASTNSTVLLLGETGTGKELFARALHDRSRRRTRALVRVNCAALPPSLFESELFGHEKGAFTGAVATRQGRFELADGGTIFLDEIGDLTPEIQAKLLRVLQEGEFERVGSSRTKRVDVRVIAATHRDLEADVANDRFREDLYYRLSVFPIHLPALRERQEDIPALVWFFIHRHQRDLGRRITKVPQAVMSALQQHAWPGNVRELQNVIERAMIWSSGDTLLLDETFDPPAVPAPDRTLTRGASLDAVQRAHIESVLHECGWRINGVNNAADRLRIHPNTLRFRMKKLGIVCPEAHPGRHRAPGTPA